MKSSSLFLLIMFTLTNKACSKENKIKEMRKGKVVEPRYQFNHPPSAEYYNPIPVAIVYEDNDNYSGKSEVSIKNEANNSVEDTRKGKFVEPRYYLNHPPLVENYNPIPVVIEYEDKYSGESETATVSGEQKSGENVKVSIVDNKNVYENATEYKHGSNEPSLISAHNKTNVKLEARPQNLNDWQIPVAIVYETDSNSYQNHQKRKTDISTDLPKSRSTYSRKIEAINSQKEQIVQTSKEDTEKVQPRIDTRVFKKRTGGPDPVIPIVEMESYVFSHNGNFRYSYEGGDGTKAYSEGKQITVDDQAGESVAGGFSYKDKEGNDYSLTYTADENGYRPVGAHLPTPPPIPPAIARALEYLATATPEPVTKAPDKSKVLVR